jgi:hypothetical protein
MNIAREHQAESGLLPSGGPQGRDHIPSQGARHRPLLLTRVE